MLPNIDQGWTLVSMENKQLSHRNSRKSHCSLKLSHHTHCFLCWSQDQLYWLYGLLKPSFWERRRARQGFHFMHPEQVQAALCISLLWVSSGGHITPVMYTSLPFLLRIGTQRPQQVPMNLTIGGGRDEVWVYRDCALPFMLSYSHLGTLNPRWDVSI